MSARDARAAVEDNPALWLEILARQPGAVRSGSAVLTDIPFALCNSVFFPRWSAEEADDRISSILAAGVPRLWWLGERCTPPDLVERLEARGVVDDVEPLPGMVLPASRLPRPPEPALPRDAAPRRPSAAGLRVEGVRDDAGLRAFGIPFGASFGIAGEALDSILAAFAAAGLDGPAIQHYVGWAGDRPVATASALVGHGVGGLYDVATLPEARGRGYGAALSLAALDGAAAAGAETLVLHASPGGLPIYERLGFETVCTVWTVATRA